MLKAIKHVLSMFYTLDFVPEILRLRNFANIMQIRERNEKGFSPRPRFSRLAAGSSPLTARSFARFVRLL